MLDPQSISAGTISWHVGMVQGLGIDYALKAWHSTAFTFMGGHMKTQLVRFAILSIAAMAIHTAALAEEISLNDFKLPKGFSIDHYAKDVLNARSMALGPSGVLFVGTRDKGNGQVYAVVDSNKDNKADEVVVIAKGLTQPNGVAIKDGSLYVAEISRIIRFDNIETTYKDNPSYTVVNDSYPKDKHHGWKYIAFGPDGKLYVPIGVNANIANPGDPYASITRINSDGSGFEIIARGVRNTVGFDWHPATKELWFTDNGRDTMGDNIPPEELNRATGPGLHFGFPHVHGKSVIDPDFGQGHKPEEFTLPAVELDPHAAALGMKFYTGSMFPASYKNQIFIAEHGSWDRNPQLPPTGGRVALVSFEGSKSSYTPFIEGWKQTDRKWNGRPVDVLVMPDGSLLVSDDVANCIYRITYKK
jgi:glucose/arabinose dehydrogenase